MSKSVFNKSCAAVGVVRRGGNVCISVCKYVCNICVHMNYILCVCMHVGVCLSLDSKRLK